MKLDSGLGAFYLPMILGLFLFYPLSPLLPGRIAPPQFSQSDRENAFRANNRGVAQLEQFNFAEAAKEFRNALAIDPTLKIAQVNLAIALFNSQEIEEARQAAEKTLGSQPEYPQTFYLLGLIARNQNREDDAVRYFQRILAINPQDVGANVNIGQIHTQQRNYSAAIEAFRRAYESEPYNSTAIYNLATALIRDNRREEGQPLIERFQALRQSGAATSIGQNYLEQGRYAEAIVSTGSEPDLVDKTPPNIKFQIADIGLPGTVTRSNRKGRSGNRSAGTLTLFDFDNDGDLDLLHAGGSPSRARLFRNDRGKFADVSRAAGDLARLTGLNTRGAVAGDIDNDTFEDVLLFGSGRPTLFRGDGKGHFKNVTAASRLGDRAVESASGALVDADHDGDLDVFLGASGALRISPASERPLSENKLFRNNGDGTFSDVSAEARINVAGRVFAVVPTDYDNRRDADLLVLGYDKRPELFQNLRNGTFRDIAEEAGLNRSAKWTSAAAGDFNKDSFVDFFFGREGEPGIFAVSDGRGNFVLKDAPAGTKGVISAQLLDYDSDGLLDLVAATGAGFVISRNLGDQWSDTVPGPAVDAQRFVSGDIDRDGDIDLLAITKSGSVRFVRNNGGEANRSKIVDLMGRVSNRSGIGSKIDMRSGSLAQKLESYSASPMPAPSDIHFGLGRRDRPDTVRVIWPSGVVQAEVEFPEAQGKQLAARPIVIEELDRKPSSCPYLYTWNGERFEFITDFLGGGEMGNWKAHGVYHYPDSDEYVRIPGDNLKSKNGRYEIRITNELEEVLFLDHLKLIAVEHDKDTEVYPNEGLGIPTAGKRILYTTRSEQAPVSAVDGNGNDVLQKVKRLDREFYDSFDSLNIRGYAEPHTLTLKLDERRGYNGRTLLLLTGWTDYAFSSDNLAASQSGKRLFFPKLQVRSGRGEWQTVIDSMGISVGRPQTLVVDLTGKFLSDSREVRIITNVKTYWDKIAVDTSEPHSTKTTELRPAVADLRERGFSAETSFGGMIVPDYETILNDNRWKYFSGRFTRTGDVKPLLNIVDDVFLISKTGDELALSFEALPEPSPGEKYTFLLYADGYSKEMDINSGSPDAVMPLPFKGMTTYPYGADEHFPMTADKQLIYDEYTTRYVHGLVPRVAAVSR